MHGIVTMCRVLGVSPGGYYARQKTAALGTRARPTACRGFTPSVRPKGFRSGASGWRGSCARQDFTASASASGLPPRCGIAPPNPRGIWSNVTSRQRRPIACGWPTSPTFPPGRLSVPRGGARRVQPAHRGLDDGNPFADRTGAQSAQHGARPAPARRCDSSFRPWQPVHCVRLRPTLPAGRRTAVDGLGGRLLRRICQEFRV
jgi:hypothetical protein